MWKRSFPFSAPVAAGVLGLVLAGCFDSGDDDNSDSTTFRQVNLVADTSSLGAPVIDQNLTNPWGIAASPNGSIWVADNETGMSTVYDKDGNPQSLSVAIPSAAGTGEGKPTGMVANTTLEFPMPDGSGRALFLFVGEDGAVSAWNAGDTARIVLDRSDSEAVYKGMALATDNGKGFLYLANFPGRKIEVVDGAYQRDMSKAFVDSALPADYGPFNIVPVGPDLYVAYAKISSEGDEEEPGVGNGIIDVFTTGGVLVRRFATGGNLNAPWGITQINGDFGPFKDGVFVGNFGDGLINVYDSQGNLQGQMNDASGTPMKIDGLWALYHDGGGKMYFTAGPEEETHGIFGYLAPR